MTLARPDLLIVGGIAAVLLALAIGAQWWRLRRLERLLGGTAAERLLPEGAIETINEWGFETLDEAVIEMEDLVYVHEHLVDRLRSMGEQA